MAKSLIYFGHISDYTGYGVTARAYIKALEKQGYDVFPVCVDFPEKIVMQGPEWVERYKRKPPDSPDVFLTHKSPWNQEGGQERIHDFLPARQAGQRVYLTVFETTKWPSQWAPNLNEFDKIVTFSSWQVDAAKKILAKKIHCIPHIVEPFQIEKPKSSDPFTFFAEFSRVTYRKGLDVLLNAYFYAFTAADNVVLRIKITDSTDNQRRFDAIMGTAINSFRWEKLPKIELCNAYLTDSQMQRLFDKVDCYVSTSRGEGFQLNLAQAAVNGIQCLAPANREIGDWHNGYLKKRNHYPSQKIPVITDDFYAHGMIIDTSQMYWHEPNIRDLAEMMRIEYRLGHRQIDYGDIIENLSEEKIGKQLAKVLEV